MIRSAPAATAALTACLFACSSVEVTKVPTPSQYKDWTDEDQKRADSLKGVRFYLPRPYVNVFESFPISADVYVVAGTVDPDGEYVTLDALSDPELIASFGGATAPTVSLGRVATSDPRTLERLRADADRARAESGREGLTRDDLQQAVDGLREDLERMAEAAAGGDEEQEADDEPRTGQNQFGVTSTNDPIGYQPLRGNFDLVYLPDFEEQYVVRGEGNLGSAKFALQLGQGWSLLGLEGMSDNSELTKRVFGLLDTAIEAGEAAVAGATGGGSTAALARMNLARAESETEPLELPGGSPVALKVVLLRYAAKGLYPILKPRELVDPYSVTMPVGRSVTTATTHRIGGSIVPVYPYQRISFNTFDYLSIELLTVGGLPFGDLYDRTGTQGDAGDRQTADLADAIRTNAGGAGPPAMTQGIVNEVKRALNESATSAGAGDPLRDLAPVDMLLREDGLTVVLDGVRRTIDKEAYRGRIVELLRAEGVDAPPSGDRIQFVFNGE